jgi:RHS repeat-associated protein
MGSILHHETLRTAAGKPNPCRGLIQACAQMGYRRLPAPDLTRLYLGPRRVPVWRVRAGSLRTLHTAADSSIWDSVRPRCAAAKWWLRHSGSPTGVAQRVSMALAIACRRWYPHIVTLGNKTLRNGRRPWTPTGRALPAGRGTRKPKMCSLCDLSVGQAGRLLLVQERTSANTPTVTYTRGRDLSGSLAGGGGIGGLLARSHGYSGGNWSSHNAYHADGNGNVTALVNSAGALQASYRYDPYGRYLAGGGTLASANVMRFSSKPWVGFAGSATSGLYYYGYRFYDPYLQRWINRDPIADIGFMTWLGNHNIVSPADEPNRYMSFRNTPVNRFDPHGLTDLGPFGGRCCNRSSSVEWALVDEGYWVKLPPGSCTWWMFDCDGMTCKGGFYHTGGIAGIRLVTSTCTDGPDDCIFRGRRWTPTRSGESAKSPTERGSIEGDIPPGYIYEK